MPRYCVLSAPVANNTMPPGSSLLPSVLIVAVWASQSIDCAGVASIGAPMPVDRQPTPKVVVIICGLVEAGETEPYTESWTMVLVVLRAVTCTSQHNEAGAPRKTNGTSNG